MSKIKVAGIIVSALAVVTIVIGGFSAAGIIPIVASEVENSVSHSTSEEITDNSSLSKKYTVKFYKFNVLLETVRYEENADLVIPFAENDERLVMEADERYTKYEFIGWDINNDGLSDVLPDKVNQNLNIIACYKVTPKIYTLNFYGRNNEIILTREAYFGDTSFSKTNRNDESLYPSSFELFYTSGGYKYEFEGWDKEEQLNYIRQNLDLYPIYEKSEEPIMFKIYLICDYFNEKISSASHYYFNDFSDIFLGKETVNRAGLIESYYESRDVSKLNTYSKLDFAYPNRNSEEIDKTIWYYGDTFVAPVGACAPRLRIYNSSSTAYNWSYIFRGYDVNNDGIIDISIDDIGENGETDYVLYGEVTIRAIYLAKGTN